jgi:hypothetical protein
MSKPILFHYLHSSACFYSFTYISILYSFLGSDTVVQKHFIFSILFLQFLQFSIWMYCLDCLNEVPSSFAHTAPNSALSSQITLCSCSELGQYLLATYHALQWSWSWSCRVATVFKNHLYTMFYLMVSICILYWCWVTLMYEFHNVMTEQIRFSVGSSKILHKHCPYMHRYVSLCVALCILWWNCHTNL